MTVSDPSAPPVRERGLHTRAGNAMGRTRTALLDGAVRAVEKYGARRATMADIASLAGVAKGTLYNHFRTQDAIYAAAVESAVRGLADECAEVASSSLTEALAVAAERVGAHPAIRRLASDEPATVAALTTIGESGPWQVARDGVVGVLSAAGVDPSAARVGLVLRWLVSFVPSASAALGEEAALLAAGLEGSHQPQRGIRTPALPFEA